jgi:dihydroorotase
VLGEETVSTYDTSYKMMPPLKGHEDIKGLFEGLADGTIDAIASDHAPHDKDSKLVEFSRATVGILGLQTSLPLLVEMCLAGTLSRIRMVDLLCAGPARSFGLPYGTLAVGSPADVVVLNPKREWFLSEDIVRSKSKNSPFLGRRLVGGVDHVFVAGRQVVRNAELCTGGV